GFQHVRDFVLQHVVVLLLQVRERLQGIDAALLRRQNGDIAHRVRPLCRSGGCLSRCRLGWLPGGRWLPGRGRRTLRFDRRPAHRRWRGSRGWRLGCRLRLWLSISPRDDARSRRYGGRSLRLLAPGEHRWPPAETIDDRHAWDRNRRRRQPWLRRRRRNRAIP